MWQCHVPRALTPIGARCLASTTRWEKDKAELVHIFGASLEANTTEVLHILLHHTNVKAILSEEQIEDCFHRAVRNPNAESLRLLCNNFQVQGFFHVLMSAIELDNVECVRLLIETGQSHGGSELTMVMLEEGFCCAAKNHSFVSALAILEYMNEDAEFAFLERAERVMASAIRANWNNTKPMVNLFASLSDTMGVHFERHDAVAGIKDALKRCRMNGGTMNFYSLTTRSIVQWRHGHEQTMMLRLALARSAPPRNGESIDQCSASSNVEELRLILREPCQAEKVFTAESSPMASAAQRGHCGVVRILCECAPIDNWLHELDFNAPRSALMQAVKADQVDCVRLLLDMAHQATALDPHAYGEVYKAALLHRSFTSALAVLDFMTQWPIPRAVLKQGERNMFMRDSAVHSQSPFWYPTGSLMMSAPVSLFASITDTLSKT